MKHLAGIALLVAYGLVCYACGYGDGHVKGELAAWHEIRDAVRNPGSPV